MLGRLTGQPVFQHNVARVFTAFVDDMGAPHLQGVWRADVGHFILVVRSFVYQVRHGVQARMLLAA